MAERQYSALRFEGSTPILDAPLTVQQQLRIPEYNRLLEVAEQVEPVPWHSGFKVRGSFGKLGKNYRQAKNVEYGNGKALHMEEYAVIALDSRKGSYKGKNMLMGCIAGDDPENLAPGSCGNCRDFVGEWMGWQTNRLEMVWGSVDGKRGLVGNYGDFTPRVFPEVAIEDLPDLVDMVDFALARKDEQFPGDPYSRPAVRADRQYTAVLETGSRLYVAGHTVPVDYHPINAIARTILRAEDAADLGIITSGQIEDLSVRSLVIASEGDGKKPPHIMFKDRQDFNNAVWVGEKLTGENLNPEIHLVTYQRDPLVVTGAWKTDHRSWLPAPFTPEAFDPNFQQYLASYYS